MRYIMPIILENCTLLALSQLKKEKEKEKNLCRAWMRVAGWTTSASGFLRCSPRRTNICLVSGQPSHSLPLVMRYFLFFFSPLFD